MLLEQVCWQVRLNSRRPSGRKEAGGQHCLRATSPFSRGPASLVEEPIGLSLHRVNAPVLRNDLPFPNWSPKPQGSLLEQLASGVLLDGTKHRSRLEILWYQHINNISVLRS